MVGHLPHLPFYYKSFSLPWALNWVPGDVWVFNSSLKWLLLINWAGRHTLRLPSPPDTGLQCMAVLLDNLRDCPSHHNLYSNRPFTIFIIHFFIYSFVHWASTSWIQLKAEQIGNRQVYVSHSIWSMGYMQFGTEFMLRPPITIL